MRLIYKIGNQWLVVLWSVYKRGHEIFVCINITRTTLTIIPQRYNNYLCKTWYKRTLFWTFRLWQDYKTLLALHCDCFYVEYGLSQQWVEELGIYNTSCWQQFSILIVLDKRFKSESFGFGCQQSLLYCSNSNSS